MMQNSQKTFTSRFLPKCIALLWTDAERLFGDPTFAVVATPKAPTVPPNSRAAAVPMKLTSRCPGWLPQLPCEHAMSLNPPCLLGDVPKPTVPGRYRSRCLAASVCAKVSTFPLRIGLPRTLCRGVLSDCGAWRCRQLLGIAASPPRPEDPLFRLHQRQLLAVPRRPQRLVVPYLMSRLLV